MALTDLTTYLDWPGLTQVFRVERTWRARGTTKRAVQYGITRLYSETGTPALCAAAARQWGDRGPAAPAQRRDLRRRRQPRPCRAGPHRAGAAAGCHLCCIVMGQTPVSAQERASRNCFVRHARIGLQGMYSAVSSSVYASLHSAVRQCITRNDVSKWQPDDATGTKRL